MRAAIALLAFVIAATACTPPEPATASPTAANTRSVTTLRVRALGPQGAIAGATVCAAPLAGDERCAPTGSDGRASFALAPGTYFVRARPPEGERLGDSRTQVSLTNGADVDLAFPFRGRIAGRVMDDAGAAAAGADVCAHPANDGPVLCARTGADGRYEVAGAPAIYKLEASGAPGARLVPEWLDDRTDSGEADPVDVRVADALGTDITLARGVYLEGVVRAARDGRSIAKAQICTRTLAAPRPFDCDRSDAQGAYRAIRAPGQYYVWIVPPDEEPLIPQYWDRAATGVGARTLTLTADTRIDVALNEGPRVTGRVLTPDGVPVSAAQVCIDTAFTTGRICRPTDAQGRYLVATRPETYILSVIPPEGSDIVGSYWDRKRTWVDADEVAVRADVTRDIVVVRGLIVRGTVRDATGAPVQDASVTVSDAVGFLSGGTTDIAGRYQLAVPVGRYVIDVFAPRFGELVSVQGVALAVNGPTTYDATLSIAGP